MISKNYQTSLDNVLGVKKLLINGEEGVILTLISADIEENASQRQPNFQSSHHRLYLSNAELTLG
jgi:hypothetical protein